MGPRTLQAINIHFREKVFLQKHNIILKQLTYQQILVFYTINIKGNKVKRSLSIHLLALRNRTPLFSEKSRKLKVQCFDEDDGGIKFTNNCPSVAEWLTRRTYKRRVAGSNLGGADRLVQDEGQWRFPVRQAKSPPSFKWVPREIQGKARESVGWLAPNHALHPGRGLRIRRSAPALREP